MSNFRNHEKEWLDNLVLDESRETYRSMNAKQQTIVRFAFEYAYRLQETKVKEARTIAEKGQYQADYFAIRDALDVSKIRNNMFEQQLQQAHRAAEESAKDAHRRGWEQAKREAIKEIQSNPIMYPVTVGGGIAGQYVVDTVAVNAIARMEYKKEAKDE